MAASSDGYLFYRTAVGSDLTTQSALASGVTGSAAFITVRNALSHVYVQRILINPTTTGVGVLEFREGDATGALLVSFLQPSGVTGATTIEPFGERTCWYDFGPKGWKLAVGKNLHLVRSSATGPAANVVVEAYGAVSTGPLAMATTN
jgi:hypothetical protein